MSRYQPLIIICIIFSSLLSLIILSELLFQKHSAVWNAHISSSFIFMWLMLLQCVFMTAHKKIIIHKIIGFFSIASGYVITITALILTDNVTTNPFDSVLLEYIRFGISLLMIFFLTRAVVSICYRRYGTHWQSMLRCYALAMGAGTQIITHIPWFIMPSLLNETTRTISMLSAWAINLVIAELVIRNLSKQSRHKIPTTNGETYYE
ncbi:hypothetical protein DN730_17025 [Marinomonas piezotolerans]|uniref:DUF2306 domain-containing protein n=1 Tax=Marinomonas piezotolerans TaxID=2213058 RepID=A0A370U573_9GAMM|nr:DUF2306 domain-containing protein [Marinomonas piezotolerans]RDL42898.1 hypothetical protein DN730_17025 [Marinomonas piezotolerans]